MCHQSRAGTRCPQEDVQYRCTVTGPCLVGKPRAAGTEPWFFRLRKIRRRKAWRTPFLRWTLRNYLEGIWKFSRRVKSKDGRVEMGWDGVLLHQTRVRTRDLIIKMRNYLGTATPAFRTHCLILTYESSFPTKAKRSWVSLSALPAPTDLLYQTPGHPPRMEKEHLGFS